MYGFISRRFSVSSWASGGHVSIWEDLRPRRPMKGLFSNLGAVRHRKELQIFLDRDATGIFLQYVFMSRRYDKTT